MTIQLPAELVDVAAQAGVTWPEADESAMAATAVAWRRAGADLRTLGADADTGAQSALGAVDSDAGDAARRHWDGYVREDGRLPVAIRECERAAERLDHGAEQVRAAKNEIIRQLVALKQQQEAAQTTAAATGLPTPLAGLDTVLAGASVSVSNVTSQLTESIRLDTGSTVRAQPLLGQTGPLTDPTLTGTVTGGHPTRPGHAGDPVLGLTGDVTTTASGGHR